MSKVTVEVIGGEQQVIEDFDTLFDLMRHLECEGYSASINGEPVAGDVDLEDFQFITLSPPVKGA